MKPDPENDPLLKAVHRSMAEVTGEVKRAAKKAKKETPDIKSKGFFGPSRASRASCDQNGRQVNSGVRRFGQVLYCSDGTPRTISQCWQDIFSQNEKWMLQDEDLEQIVLMLWPDRVISKNMHHVQRIRGQYNHGSLPGMTSPPEKQSRRFVRVGASIYTVTPRGKYQSTVYEPKAPVDPKLGKQATGFDSGPYRDGAGKSMCQVDSTVVEGPDGPLFALFHKK